MAVMQSFLLKVYGFASRIGLMNIKFFRFLFEKIYIFYKFYEASNVQCLDKFVPVGSVVIDVGANIGFFTRYFSNWVGAAGAVIAVEPDDENFSTLQKRCLQNENVLCIRAIATNFDGSGRLHINPIHPGDHRIALESSNSVSVAAYTLDTLVSLYCKNSKVSFIKIDVQGAEMMVLTGAEALFENHRPSVFIEIDEKKLRDYGASADQIFNYFYEKGYEAFLLRGKNISVLDRAHFLETVAVKNYFDVLFLPRNLCLQLNSGELETNEHRAARNR